MRAYINPKRVLLKRFSHRYHWLVVLLMSTLLVFSSFVWAAGFQIISANTQLRDRVYLLNARIRYDLSEEVLNALNNSVPLTISLEMEVRRPRPLLWDETVAKLSQVFVLEYHALAQQYVVNNVNNGTYRSFPTRRTATDYIGHIRDFPMVDSSLLPTDANYYGLLRARLDIESLPAPLRPVAYLSNDWRLTSEWYRWPLS